jgi:hypothetical protein
MNQKMFKLANKISCSVLLVFSLSACNADTQSASKTEASLQTTNQDTTAKANIAADKEKDKNHMTLKGQVVYNDFEGGFYGFIADNGDKYTPMNLPMEHRKNGLIISMQAEVMKDMMTTTQYGELIKVSNVEVIDASKVSEAKGAQY